MLPLLALLVLIAGILMFALASNAKVVEIGKAMMWTGLLVVLLSMASWHAVVLR